MSYGLTSRLLEDVLPLDKAVSTAALSQQVQQVAQRLESELGEEQPMFSEGCPRAWASLPEPDAPLTVGLDGVGTCMGERETIVRLAPSR